MKPNTTPGWTWHAKRHHETRPQSDGVDYHAGGVDHNSHYLGREQAEELARIKFRAWSAPGWAVEVYVMSPDREPHPVAESGAVWWPRLEV